MEMRTIKQVATELNISTQAVYKKINKSMKNILRNHIKKEHGQTLISEHGFEIMKSSLQPLDDNENQLQDENIINDKSTENGDITDDIDNIEVANDLQPNATSNDEKKSLNEQITYLRKQNKLLQDELIKEREHSRDITNKLIELTNKSQELTRNSQVLLKQEQDKTALLIPEQIDVSSSIDGEKKKGFFKKIFNKNKSGV